MTEATQETGLALPDNPPVGGKAAKAAGLPSIADGEFANLLDRSRFEQVYSVAQLFAQSQMVPQHYQGKPADCFIGVQMAIRLGVDPFMFLQNTYIVHGRPGMEAKLAIALINSSGLFEDALDYEIQGGDDPTAPEYRVRAYARRKSTGTMVYGPWIDWKLVKGEKWDANNGSKWKTMPAMMFQYRAATFFGRLHCPERLMGMQTADENEDVGRRYVESESFAPDAANGGSKAAQLASRIQEPNAGAADEGEPQPTADADEPSPTSEPAGGDAAAEGAGGEGEQVDTDTGEVTQARGKPKAKGIGPNEQVLIQFHEANDLSYEAAKAALDSHCEQAFGKGVLDLKLSELSTLQASIKKGEVAAGT